MAAAGQVRSATVVGALVLALMGASLTGVVDLPGGKAQPSPPRRSRPDLLGPVASKAPPKRLPELRRGLSVDEPPASPR